MKFGSQEMKDVSTMTGKKAGPGSGNFEALVAKLKGKKGVTDPGGLAAFIGKKKYGSDKMEEMSEAGRNSRTNSK